MVAVEALKLYRKNDSYRSMFHPWPIDKAKQVRLERNPANARATVIHCNVISFYR